MKIAETAQRTHRILRAAKIAPKTAIKTAQKTAQRITQRTKNLKTTTRNKKTADPPVCRFCVQTLTRMRAKT